MQIKDLRAKIEELEKRGVRDSIANEQEWQAFILKSPLCSGFRIVYILATDFWEFAPGLSVAF